ncbi:MAG: MotA/TolQ/ExbB proton channel family protein [Gammaproteobacteria bacterium]|nr:MotA/TolQ/ExbB proton channel family protein [Gammaproteobacteria bacterium]
MYDILVAGGWLMLPLLICSIFVIGIALERLWALNTKKISPSKVTAETWQQLSSGKKFSNDELRRLRRNSPLGSILAAGLVNVSHGRDTVRESMEAAANQVIHELERFLTALSVIATISPLIGLLGTVMGMIDVFSAIVVQGSNDISMLAAGINKALITTAAGLSVAIPATMLDRYFTRRVESISVVLEKECVRFIDALFAKPVAKRS